MGVMLGSLATFVMILVLGAVVGVVLSTIYAFKGIAGTVEGGVVPGLVGVSLTLLLAFFLGGYIAGRTPSLFGIRQGLLVALWALVAAMFLAVVGTTLWLGWVNGLSGVRFPSTLDDVQDLSAMMPVFGVLTLILPFVGGATGGVRGAKRGRKRRP